MTQVRVQRRIQTPPAAVREILTDLERASRAARDHGRGAQPEPVWRGHPLARDPHRDAAEALAHG